MISSFPNLKANDKQNIDKQTEKRAIIIIGCNFSVSDRFCIRHVSVVAKFATTDTRIALWETNEILLYMDVV